MYEINICLNIHLELFKQVILYVYVNIHLQNLKRQNEGTSACLLGNLLSGWRFQMEGLKTLFLRGSARVSSRLSRISSSLISCLVAHQGLGSANQDELAFVRVSGMSYCVACYMCMCVLHAFHVTQSDANGCSRSRHARVSRMLPVNGR